ncbi:MAG: hypothetical protein KDB69_03125 [Acidimicrobiia bacterium]|nr:hypothetical protein [Acidimicrobiia bacterium]
MHEPPVETGTFDARPEMDGSSTTTFTEEDVVFNVVWTGTTFSTLTDFTTTVLARSRARMRFIANACPPSEIDAMVRFSDRHAGRVVEVMVASSGRMLRHGDCLDLVLNERDDGPLFCLLDPDILVTAPFMGVYLRTLDRCSAVTSGREIWSDDNIRPNGHIGVNGEIFFDRDGFVFGSPHFALYRSADLRATTTRWGVGFSSAGSDVPEPAREQLKSMGRSYWIYDTGKVVNILLQADGSRLVHIENDHLVHVGGLAHFLSPPEPTVSEDGTLIREWGQTANWGEWEGQGDRYFVAGHAARLLKARAERTSPPEMPTDVDATMTAKLHTLRAAIATLDHPTDR